MRHARALLVLTVILAPVVVDAAVIAPLALPDLVRLADRVVVGRVGPARARWADDGRHIVTDALVEVDEVLKGDPAARLRVQTAGGVVGEIGQRVAGAAPLRTGDRVLLFLEEDAATAARPAPVDDVPGCRVVGLARGLYLLVEDDGRLIATQDLGGLEVQDPGTGQLRAAVPETQDARQLLVRVRALASSRPVEP